MVFLHLCKQNLGNCLLNLSLQLWKDNVIEVNILTSVLVHRRPAIFFSKKYRAAWALAYCQVWFRCGRKSLSHLINADSLRYTLNWKVQSAVSLLSNIQERDKNKKWELIHYRYFAYPLFPFYSNFIFFNSCCYLYFLSHCAL